MSETGMFHGLEGLDRKMLGFIDFDEGYFVEVGANDGVAQSNTLYRMTRYLEAHGYRYREPLSHHDHLFTDAQIP